MAVVKYQCKNCGDNLNFDANSGKLVCPSCLSDFEIEVLKKEEEAKKKPKAKKKKQEEKSTPLTIPKGNHAYACACGEKLEDCDDGYLRCSSCGSQFVQETKAVLRIYGKAIEEQEEEVEEIIEEEELSQNLELEPEIEEEIEEHTTYTSYDETISKEYHCDNCGAVLVTECNTAATICVFCQSPMIVSERLSGQYAPAQAIPFKMDIKTAHENFKKWCKKGIITPNDFRMLERVKDIQGIYVPFWLFDLNVKAKGEANCTKVSSYTSGNYRITETKHYNVYRNVASNYYKLPADASIKMPDEFMDKLEPFYYEDLQPFNMSYLAGYGAEKYDYTNKDLFPRIKKRVENFISNYIRENIKGYSSVRLHTVNSKIAQKDAVYTLLPVYLMNYKYKDKVYTFVMNGQTGKVAGKPPISKFKAIFYFIIISSAITALLSFLFSIEGVEDNILGIFIFLLNILILLAELN